MSAPGYAATSRTGGVIRLLAVVAVLAASLGLVAPGAHGADSEGSATGDIGRDPLPDLVAGDRKFTITSAKAAPGGTLKFKASGFVREEGDGGQTLTFKLNDIDLIGSGVEADDEGNANGTITLPGAKVFKRYQSEYDSDRWWIRALVGAGRPDGEPDFPASSLHDGFKLVGLGGGPAARAVGGSVNAKGTHLALTLKPGTAKKTSLLVESLSPVPVGPKPRMITVAKGTAKAQKKKVSLKLTNDGKRYFKKHDALYVAAVSKARGSKAVTKIFKIEKKK